MIGEQLRYFGNLEILRGVAAIAVVLYHASATAGEYYWINNVFSFIAYNGAIGVDIFFVLSGFLMGNVLCQGNMSPIRFIKRRALRIIPSYYVMNLLIVTLLVVYPDAFNQRNFNGIESLFSFLMITSFYDVHDPLVFVGWTLEIEFYFYLLCAVTLLTKNAVHRLLFCLIGCLTIGFWLRDFIIVELFYGLVINYFTRTTRKDLKLSVVCIVLCLSIFLLSNVDGFGRSDVGRHLTWGICASMLIIAAIYQDQSSNAVLTYLGKISYSMYLVQVLTIPVTFKFASFFVVPSATFVIMSCVAFTFTVAATFHTLVESPLQLSLRKYR